MYFDALTTAAISDELEETIIGGFIQKLYIPNEGSLAFEVYNHRERLYLFISIEASHPRITLLPEKPPHNPDLVTPIALLLRKHALGARIEEIFQPVAERVIGLSIAKRSPELNSKHWLYAELMGRHSNLIMLDENRTTIVESLKRVTSDMSKVRVVLPKYPYIPPPARAGIHPNDLTRDKLGDILKSAKDDTPLWQLLVTKVVGISPLLGKEIAYRSTGDVEVKVSQIKDIYSVIQVVQDMVSLWRTRNWEPCIAVSNDKVLAYAPYRMFHLAEKAELRVLSSMSEAINAYQQAPARKESTGVAKTKLINDLQELLVRARQKVRSLQEQESNLASMEKLREEGETILSHLYEIQPGQAELVVGNQVIKLDPMLSPSENAQKRFEEYKRRKRALQEIPKLIEQAKLEVSTLEEALAFAQMSETDAEASQLRKELERSGILGGHRVESRQNRKPQNIPKIMSFSPFPGVKIMVGRSSIQNNHLLEQAKPDDWWFHARNLPGSHVVVRGNNPHLDESTIEIAAKTAAYYSSARDSSSVEVVYCPVRYVRKIKGAGPGQVTYRNEKSINVKPEKPVG